MQCGGCCRGEGRCWHTGGGAVEVHSGLSRLHGTLCLPESEDRAPAVVLLHGYGSYRDELMGFTKLAERLRDHGVASLRIDLRGCGESGEAGAIHPDSDWIEDAHAAISFLSSIDAIDIGHVGLVGMGVGGGVAVQAAALDGRVGCVVALAPVADGEAWLEHLWTSELGSDAWETFLWRLEDERCLRASTGDSRIVPIEDVLVYSPPDRAARADVLERFPQLTTHVYLTSAESLLRFKPVDHAHRLSCPVRLIHSRLDANVLSAHSQWLYDAAPEPRDLQIVDVPAHHFWLADAAEGVHRLTLDWVLRHLAR